MRTIIIRLFILLGLVFPALASVFQKRPTDLMSPLPVFVGWARLCAHAGSMPRGQINPAHPTPPYHHFRLLMTGLVFCLGALSANTFALMGGAIQNGNVVPGDVSGANGMVVSTLAGMHRKLFVSVT